MDPCIARAISTQESLLRVRGMEREAFTMLVERSMKENGRTIKNTDRLVELICTAFQTSHQNYRMKISNTPLVI